MSSDEDVNRPHVTIYARRDTDKHGRPRITIHARPGTENANPTSTADQAEARDAPASRFACEPVEPYADREPSGYRLDRPGFVQVGEEERAGQIEIVPCATADEASLIEVVGALLEELLSHHRKLVAARSRKATEMRFAPAGPSRRSSAAARPDLRRRTEGV